MDLTLHIIISVIDLVNVCAIGLIFYFLGDFVFLVRVDLWSFAKPLVLKIRLFSEKDILC